MERGGRPKRRDFCAARPAVEPYQWCAKGKTQRRPQRKSAWHCSAHYAVLGRVSPNHPKGRRVILCSAEALCSSVPCIRACCKSFVVFVASCEIHAAPKLPQVLLPLQGVLEFRSAGEISKTPKLPVAKARKGYGRPARRSGPTGFMPFTPFAVRKSGASGGRPLSMVRVGRTSRRLQRKVAWHRSAHRAFPGRVHLPFHREEGAPTSGSAAVFQQIAAAIVSSA